MFQELCWEPRVNKRSSLPLRNPSCSKGNRQGMEVRVGIKGESPN